VEGEVGAQRQQR